MDRFILNFILTERSIAICLSQKVSDSIHPLTKYYYWPQRDAWEDIRIFIDSEKWISNLESVSLLNQITEVINYWQDGDPSVKKDVSKLREEFPSSKFPNLKFYGAKKKKRFFKI